MFQIEGTEIDDINFDNFKTDKIFINYDFPRLILMTSPDKEKWIFSWLCSNELEVEIGKEIIDKWIAFKISDKRLEEIESGDISLRELIILCETFEDEYLPFYVFDSISTFNIQKIWKVTPESIPDQFLPLEDIPIIKPKDINYFDGFKEDRLNLDIHFFPRTSPQGEIPIALLGPFQDNLQNCITRGVYNLDSQEYYVDIEDWTHINAIASGVGSYRLYCSSKETDSDKTNKLRYILELIKEYYDDYKNNSINKIEDLNKKIGKMGIYHLESFLYFIIQSDISANLKWNYPNKKWKSILINKRKAQILLDKLIEYNKRDEEPITISIQLTKEESEELRKSASGTGGFQGLLERLQSNLDEQNILTINQNDIEKIIRYGLYYSQGGFQKRLQGVINALERVKYSVSGLR